MNLTTQNPFSTYFKNIDESLHTHGLGKHAELTGFNTNVSKSKVMYVNSTCNNKQITRAAGVETEDANEFIYIGGTVNTTVQEKYQMETWPCKNCLQYTL